MTRALAGAAGTLSLRGLRVEQVAPPSLPAVKTLTAGASLSADGGTLYVMVVNKSLDQDLDTALDLGGFVASSARAWRLTGPAIDATNEQDPATCTVTEQEAPAGAGALEMTFPARSLTAVEFTR